MPTMKEWVAAGLPDDPRDLHWANERVDSQNKSNENDERSPSSELGRAWNNVRDNGTPQRGTSPEASNLNFYLNLDVTPIYPFPQIIPRPYFCVPPQAATTPGKKAWSKTKENLKK